MLIWVIVLREKSPWLQNKAKSLANNQYDLNDFNCTDYALEVFNSVRPMNPIVVSDWFGPGTLSNYGTTPNGLYQRLRQMSISNSDVHFGTANAVQGNGLCP